MNTKYSAGQKVQALDTISGVWRQAMISTVTELSVELNFPNFKNKKGINTASAQICQSCLEDEATWPIRPATNPANVATANGRPSRRRFTPSGQHLSNPSEVMTGYSDLALGYAPSTRIFMDTVSCHLNYYNHNNKQILPFFVDFSNYSSKIKWLL